MRFGISSTIVKDRCIWELLNRLKSDEIRFLEIRCEKIHLDYENKNVLKEIFSFVKEKNIKIISVHPPDWIDIGSENEHLRMKSVREAQKCILVAYHLGAEKIVLHPSNSNDGMEKIFKSLKEIKEFAEEWGKKVIIENTMPGKKGGELKELLEISDNFKLRICFDTSHYFSKNKDIEDIEIIKEIIDELHISDSLMDGNDNHLFPGEGRIEWGKLFRKIPISDKDVIIEIMPSQDIEREIEKINIFKEKVLDGLYSEKI
uniref:Xylose isomerase-like TIM barrel domain-containing protein n=1 Tax=candidate division WOR-3 bacterium TaxID=2052148 RepID=A0A7C4Y5W4_UNCW3